MKKWLYGTALGFLALTCAASVGISGCQDVQLYRSAPCTQTSDCVHGFCVDGVCCESACTDLCHACSAAKKGIGFDGVCESIRDGLDPDNECPRTCNGNNGCTEDSIPAMRGSNCSTDSECVSGFCVDGVCCDSACDGACETCIAAEKGSGFDGYCRTITNATDPDGECNGGSCVDSCGCTYLPPNGTSCNADGQCCSGHCVDGVCCATDCSGRCVACDLPGSLGTCAPVPWDQIEPVCTTACDSYGGCLRTAGNACTAGSQCISQICNDLICDSPKPANGPLVWLTTLVAKNLVTTTDLRVDQIVARNDGSIFIDGMEVGGFTLNGTKTENFCCFWQILGVEFTAAGAPTTVAVNYCSDNFGNSCSRNIIKTQGDVQFFSTYSKSSPTAAPSTHILKSAPPLYTRKLIEVDGAASDAAGNSVLKGTSSIKDNDSPVDYGDGVKYPYDRLVKYDASGNVTLNTPFPVPEASIYESSFWSFAFASNGDIYGSSLQNDMKLAKISATGVVQWIKSIPVQLGAGAKQSMALQLDAAENLMVAFNFSGNVDLGNGPMMAIGTTDLALVKLDSTGNVLWQKHYGSPGFDLHNFTMDRTGADDMAIAGEFSGSTDFGQGPLTGTAFIAKFDSNGNELWHIDVQKSLQDGGIAVSGNPTGDVYMSTSSTSFDLGWGPILAGKMGIIVAKYASM